MKTFSLQTRLYSGQGSLAVLKRFTNKHIWIICDGFSCALAAAGNPASGVARR
ncbi:iron-containing NADPH-dependent propanol dehydrogenase [Klebsiella oxytoca]|nr:iron-containing NADPH-dependent propanol dehydrogenase [Klebsiella oxytoca]